MSFCWTLSSRLFLPRRGGQHKRSCIRVESGATLGVALRVILGVALGGMFGIALEVALGVALGVALKVALGLR